MAESIREFVTEPARTARLRRSCRIIVSGQVQGVGFRPFIFRLAKQHGLDGQVRNCLGEVEIIVTGTPQDLANFRRELIEKAPPLSKPFVDSVTETDHQACGGFRIVESRENAKARIFLPPDYFMCEECLAELNDPCDRRYRYPFINCTQCGPRYTLITKLPYDRANTSMAKFPLCASCLVEYENPLDRRFHAEPVACPDCGPQLHFVDRASGQELQKEMALHAAVTALRAGRIVAVRGIGGYHLMCDAGNEQAVDELRRRKQRPHKPLAIMVPISGDDGLAGVREIAVPSVDEAECLTSAMRPIVLCRKKAGARLAESLAPGLDELGVFLPYSPLHQLLLDMFAAPLVATSGNLSGEPVLTEVEEATRRLGMVADAFLHHDRPIVRPADDPVFRRIGGRLRPLRIGRGSAPRELTLPWRQPVPLLAVGGHMKGSIALSWDDRVIVSPHIGEMDSPRSVRVFEQVCEDLQRLYKVRAEKVVCDAHPAYTTHRWAMQRQDLAAERVWHHRAHASALAAEHAGPGEWLVFTWDGVGLGEDGTLWGGEALHGAPGRWQRCASLRPFHLPGGERAGREPWRSAAALSWACQKQWREFPDSQGLAYFAWQRRMNSPASSAAGRLFDAAACLVCDIEQASFEAQGPMMLESLCRQSGELLRFPMETDPQGVLRGDWQPLFERLADKSLAPVARAEMFHSSMANLVLQQARRVREQHNVDHVGLTGGVFQNRVLTDQALALLRSDGFDVRLATKLPCNDAALCFGQAAENAALYAMQSKGGQKNGR
ncbi:MAG: carbamoyltransferase HypF [Gammaproteobacteria bacterium]|nr:carbamoyltransferase HypF [Gammaproteobacteria bacterium]MDH4314142.1 carbamoyltransferase HypF [Gammaproteobacteria bacterium]MDH5212782.1 carbamoyltransferase HypF [Gammaproteobacteria bacterium]